MRAQQYYHKCSTDEKSQHMYCPCGSNSWCTWRRAEATNTLESYTYKPALSQQVAGAILLVYKDLTDHNLLEKCLSGFTQNQKESFNATIWQILLTSKSEYVGRKIIEVVSFTAANVFNEGYNAILKIMVTMSVQIGLQTEAFAQRRDEHPLWDATRFSSQKLKDDRTAHRQKQQALHDEELEGVLYGPRIGD